MDRRTTFALDEPTIRRLRRLADRWRVSQAEVVRRAIERAEREAETETAALLQRLETYQARGGLDGRAAEEYLGEVAENRADWGRGG